jgi:hypothetical protein
MLGYGWHDNEDGTSSILLDVDLTLQTPSGETVASKPKFLSTDIRSTGRPMETYLALAASLRDFPPGPYSLVFDVHDRASGKQATFSVPITLAGAPAGG